MIKQYEFYRFRDVCGVHTRLVLVVVTIVGVASATSICVFFKFVSSKSSRPALIIGSG
jgi:uncharacterized membrane protein YuzA (DUF378 family)